MARVYLSSACSSGPWMPLVCRCQIRIEFKDERPMGGGRPGAPFRQDFGGGGGRERRASPGRSGAFPFPARSFSARAPASPPRCAIAGQQNVHICKGNFR